MDPAVHKSKKAAGNDNKSGPHEQGKGERYLRPGPMCPKKSVKRKRALEQKEWQQMYNYGRDCSHHFTLPSKELIERISRKAKRSNTGGALSLEDRALFPAPPDSRSA